MVVSMTGYGACLETQSGSRGTVELSIEIRTVNAKFLDVAVRAPRTYAALEPELIRFVKTRLRRGRIDIFINERLIAGQARPVNVNIAQAAALKLAYEEVSQKLGLTAAVSLRDLLKFPEWIATEDAPVNQDEQWALTKSCLNKALNEVQNSRLAEGKALEAAIQTQRQKFHSLFESIRLRHDDLMKAFQSRARDRLQSLFRELGVEMQKPLDSHRLEQEVVYWVGRSDFQEEIDRITHHLTTFDQLMSNEGELGRKLEFLVQELHREVNTLGSKCSDASVTPTAIEMKASIERIREQIQNIE